MGSEVSDSELKEISMGDEQNVIKVKSTAYLPLQIPRIFEIVGSLEGKALPGLLDRVCVTIGRNM